MFYFKPCYPIAKRSSLLELLLNQNDLGLEKAHYTGHAATDRPLAHGLGGFGFIIIILPFPLQILPAFFLSDLPCFSFARLSHKLLATPFAYNIFMDHTQKIYFQ